jgi:hypothetical protein
MLIGILKTSNSSLVVCLSPYGEDVIYEALGVLGIHTESKIWVITERLHSCWPTLQALVKMIWEQEDGVAFSRSIDCLHIPLMRRPVGLLYQMVSVYQTTCRVLWNSSRIVASRNLTLIEEFLRVIQHASSQFFQLWRYWGPGTLELQMLQTNILFLMRGIVPRDLFDE